MEQVTFGVRGVVTDIDSGDFLTAEIYILGHEADSSWVYSDISNGNYHRMVYQGSYDIRYSAPGYFPQTIQGVNVVNRQATVLDVQLKNNQSNIINISGPEFKVFPNPVISEYFQVSLDQSVDKLDIYNATGKLVLSREDLLQGQYFFNVSGWDTGVYVIRIYNGNDVKSKKIQVL